MIPYSNCRRVAARLLLPALLALACEADTAGPAPSPGLSGPLPPLAAGAIAIVDVNIVPMTDDEVLPGRTVLIRDGLIAAIGVAADIDVPADAQRIEGDGRWLIPGLMDMHVHLRRGDLTAYRRAGITTVRNMWGTSEVWTLRAEALAGSTHPTIFSAGPGLDGSRPVHPGTIVVTEPGAAREAVRDIVAEGWDFVKVYNSLDPEVYAAILDEARRAGIAVVGHVPWEITIGAAADAGHGSVAHMTGIAEAVAGGRAPAGWLSYDGPAAEEVARTLARRGVWNAPTLAVLEQLATRNLSLENAGRARSNQGSAVKALYEAGVSLLAGTDAGIGLTPPGVSLGRELELFVQAGLTPYQALRAATIDAARFLGFDEQLGTIEVGKRADLVLLDGNPLEDIGALRSPVALVQRGQRLF